MALRYLFLDESGNLDFSVKGSRYFTLTTVAMDDCQVGSDLMDLRRSLARQSIDLFDQFHATEDKQIVRDHVFGVIGRRDFRIDVTILEKPKAADHLRFDPDRFYRLGVYYHLKHIIPQIVSPNDELLVVCAALGTRKQMQSHLSHLRYVLREEIPKDLIVRGALWSSAAEPCLQVADYCCWAVQRKWERQDTRSYNLISSQIKSEFDLFATGEEVFY